MKKLISKYITGFLLIGMICTGPLSMTHEAHAEKLPEKTVVSPMDHGVSCCDTHENKTGLVICTIREEVYNVAKSAGNYISHYPETATSPFGYKYAKKDPPEPQTNKLLASVIRLE
jgi:hypothetical protein